MSGKKRFESPWRPVDILWALLPLVVVRIAGLLDWLPGTGALARVLGWTVFVLVLGWMIVFPWWTFRRRGGRAVGAAPSVGGIVRELLLALPFLLLVFLVAGVAAFIIQTVSGEPSEAPRAWRAAVASEGWRFVVLVVAACGLGPVAEEVFFRWFLFHGLRKWWGGLGAALGQAALFALFHPYGVRSLVLIFVIGLLLQRIYLWRRTLMAPVFVHALFNLCAVAMTLYVASQPRPYLGIHQDVDAPNCVIGAVEPGSGAAEAGLQAGDVITSLDGQPVTSFRDLVVLLRDKEVGDRVRIGILRNDQAQTIEAVLGSTEDPYIGVRSSPDAQQCVVNAVNEQSPAARAGIRAGDTIIRFGGKPVRSISDLARMVAREHPGTAVRVRLLRDHRAEEVTIVIGRRGLR